MEGGSCNDFEYTCADPVNVVDLDGQGIAKKLQRYCSKWRNKASCAWAKIIGEMALKITRQYFGSNTEDGRGNAFQHCVWSAMLTRVIGSKETKTITDLYETRDETQHEKQNPGLYEGRKSMDLKNNADGRRIGRESRTRSEIEKRCFESPRAVVLNSANNPVIYVDNI